MSVVLIVEDEMLEQEFLKSIVLNELLPEDKVLTCESGVQAIELSKKYKPNIIIIDILIPEMDGLKAIEEIKKFLPNACISILSAYSDFSYAQKAIKLQVFEYLLKPVKPKVFKETFHKMLDSLNESQPIINENEDVESSECQKCFIEESVKYIKEHFKEKLTLEMVASKVFMNPQYFSRAFKEDMGVSFSTYVNDLKIKHACRLLETTNYPAYRISMECGFSDPSYFNRVFRAQMNMTPIDYRKYICLSMQKD